jgi:hypothetical protein
MVNLKKKVVRVVQKLCKNYARNITHFQNVLHKGSSIKRGLRLMKRRSLVRIPSPLLCGHVKKN